MTPREIAKTYPASWRIDGEAVCLPLYEHFVIAAEPVVVTVFTCGGLRVELGYKALRIGDLSYATPENLVGVIAEKIAHMIVFYPNVVTIEKIPSWARAATARALEAHEHRIRDTKTHLEWSAP